MGKFGRDGEIVEHSKVFWTREKDISGKRSPSLASEEEPIKLGVPLRALEEQVAERVNRADLYKDLPRGRKRRGWKKEFLESLAEIAKDIGEISEEEISPTVRAFRKEKRAPEITVAAES